MSPRITGCWAQRDQPLDPSTGTYDSDLPPGSIIEWTQHSFKECRSWLLLCRTCNTSCLSSLQASNAEWWSRLPPCMRNSLGCFTQPTYWQVYTRMLTTLTLVEGSRLSEVFMPLTVCRSHGLYTVSSLLSAALQHFVVARMSLLVRLTWFVCSLCMICPLS